MHRPLALALSATLSLAAVDARAQTAPRDVQLTLPGGPWTDLAWMVVASTGMLVGQYALSPPAVGLSPFDGGGHRGRDVTFDAVSDVTLVSGLALGAVGAWATDRFAQHRHGWDQLRGLAVVTESVFMTLGIVAMTKNLGECRPRAWGDASATCVGADPASPVREDRVSFPSGHTAPLAAIAGASLGLALFPERGGLSWTPMVVGAGVLSWSMMAFRVLAGAHNWIDTSTGLALGFAVGVGTAALHTRREGTSLSVGATASGVSLHGVF